MTNTIAAVERSPDGGKRRRVIRAVAGEEVGQPLRFALFRSVCEGDCVSGASCFRPDPDL